jgi:hypothetical protein
MYSMLAILAFSPVDLLLRTGMYWCSLQHLKVKAKGDAFAVPQGCARQASCTHLTVHKLIVDLERQTALHNLQCSRESLKSA